MNPKHGLSNGRIGQLPFVFCYPISVIQVRTNVTRENKLMARAFNLPTRLPVAHVFVIHTQDSVTGYLLYFARIYWGTENLAHFEIMVNLAKFSWISDPTETRHHGSLVFIRLPKEIPFVLGKPKQIDNYRQTCHFLVSNRYRVWLSREMGTSFPGSRLLFTS